ncbi:MAG: hypothetical protein LC689_09850, partial [Myxococcales bacterium]|nr:hypothetical protein [Myxococcales bacterium]
TKPPQISDVRANVKSGKVQVEARITDETGVLSAIVHHRSSGGAVQDTPMVKNDYDDVFKASFPGSGDTEYWIESSDLLGNGPSTYGSANKPVAAGTGKPGKGGGERVAKKDEEPQKQEEQQQEEQRPRHDRRTAHVTKTAEPPVIEHRAPSAQPPEGRDFTVRMKIKSDSPIGVAVMQWGQKGGQMSFTQLTHTEGDSYEAVIPGAQAKGTIEYFIAAKNAAGLLTKQGSSGNTTPYTLTFKPSAAAGSGEVASRGQSGPYRFSHLPLYRVMPGKPIVVRAQIVPTSDSGDLPDHVAVLWRGNDAQDQMTEMDQDPTGGYGGYKAKIPPQEEGAVFYQIIACDQPAKSCGDDTGSKRKWHSAMVASQPGAAQPMPLDAVSSKAPPSLPE